MKKMIFPTIVVLAIATSANPAFSARTGSGVTDASGSSQSGSGAGAPADEVRVVYPTQAAEVELDSSTPAKRAEPPVREANELDPVTPIGQIRSILETLDRLERSQEETRTELRKTANGFDDDAILAKFSDASQKNVATLFPLLEKNASDAEKIDGNVATLLKTTDGIGAKLDALAKTTENLRATVEAAQKTAASIEKIRTSRWTDCALIAILALVLIQLVGKVGAFVVGLYKTSRERLEAEIYERAQAIVNAKKPASSTTESKAKK